MFGDLTDQDVAKMAEDLAEGEEDNDFADSPIARFASNIIELLLPTGSPAQHHEKKPCGKCKKRKQRLLDQAASLRKNVEVRA